MSIKRETPCDLDGVCPYDSESWGSCEYWCGADPEPDYYYEDAVEEYEGDELV